MKITIQSSDIQVMRAIQDHSTTEQLVLMILNAMSERLNSQELIIVKPPFIFETIKLSDGQVVPFERRIVENKDNILIYYRK